MQVYGRGLVRRLPTMLDGDPRRIRMVYSLLFSLPGTPVLFYGEEIGMGENLEAEGRMAVRTPMQWNAGLNGGFSSAPKRRLRNAVVEGGYGPEHVNVQDQRRDPGSLLHFIQNLIRHYRNAPEFGWGAFEVIEQPDSAVFAHSLSWDHGRVVVLHNFGAHPTDVSLALDAPEGARLTDLLSGDSLTLDARGRADIALDGYGFRWLRVVQAGDTTQY
jgi:glycosidase